MNNSEKQQIVTILENFEINLELVDEANENFCDISSVCKLNLSSYWEDCKYIN